MTPRIDPHHPGEIYEDDKGNRWLVVSMCHEPTVTMQMIEPHWQDNQPAPIRQGGGVSGLMWNGFRKVLGAPDVVRRGRVDD